MRHAALCLWILLASPAASVAATVLPSDFALEPVIVDVFEPGRPVAFAPLPDGRFFLVERNTARIRLFAPGDAAAPVIHVVPSVSTEGERGLLGIAIDPQWPHRPFVYIFYTHADSTARVEMLTATGDISDPSSTDLSFSSAYELLTDLPDTSPIHNSGTLRFGIDGKLYVSVGDDADGCNAQDRGSLAGAILRLTVSNMPGSGAGPPAKSEIAPRDNPFAGLGDREQLVWAWGLRNPFRFTIDPATNDLFIADVGSVFFEEVNHVAFASGGGQNFGWPHREGPADPGLGLSCGSENAFTEPIYHYEHGAVASVVVGPRYRASGGPHAFPSEYEGAVFTAEIWQGWVRWLVDTGTAWEVLVTPGQPNPTDWATDVHRCIDAQQGPDGAVYFLQLSPFGGTPSGLYRIVPIRRAPVAPAVDVKSRVAPNPLTPASNARILWQALRTGPQVVSIVDTAGRSVRELFDWAAVDEHSEVPWDARRSDGRPVVAGMYFYSIVVRGAATHRGKIAVVR